MDSQMQIFLSDDELLQVSEWLGAQLGRVSDQARRALIEDLTEEIPLLDSSDHRSRALDGEREACRRFAAEIAEAYGVELLAAPKRRRAVIGAWLHGRRGERWATERDEPSRWTRRHATQLLKDVGLPPALAMSRSRAASRGRVTLEFRPKTTELRDYQEEIAAKIDILLSHGGVDADAEPANEEGRLLVYLPTGAGKTRTACEGLIRRLARGGLNRPLLIWVAHTSELCEQAIEAFRQVWLSRTVSDDAFDGDFDGAFQLWRCWGTGGDALEDALRDVEEHGKVGAIFTTNLTLAGSLMSRRGNRSPSRERRFSELCWAVVLDEAHRSPAKTYKGVFGLAGVPVLGLTATPYRSDTRGTSRLLRLFHKRFTSVTIGGDQLDMGEVERALEERKILARVDFKQLHSKQQLSDLPEADTFKADSDLLSARVEGALAANTKRNAMVMRRLLEEPLGEARALVFAINVRHARDLAARLRRAGRTAYAVVGETPPSLRRAAVGAFRRGEVEFLVTVNVLSQGFDAPKVSLVMLARPTFSPVLFNQILGRGRRGLASGGTESVRFVYVRDVYNKASGAMKRWRRVEPALRKARGS